MRAEFLELPIGTKHIIVDPLDGFTQGTFVDCYGHEDTDPIREVVRELDEMTAEWQHDARLILCKSRYTYDQFGVPKLENLCVGEDDRRSAIPEDRFHRTIEKYNNSLLSADVDLEDLLGDDDIFGAEGLTMTSCIIMSINDIRRAFSRLTIVVPADAVGSRTKQNEKAHSILEELSSRSVRNVIVVPSWRNITHVRA